MSSNSYLARRCDTVVLDIRRVYTYIYVCVAPVNIKIIIILIRFYAFYLFFGRNFLNIIIVSLRRFALLYNIVICNLSTSAGETRVSKSRYIILLCKPEKVIIFGIAAGGADFSETLRRGTRREIICVHGYKI